MSDTKEKNVGGRPPIVIDDAMLEKCNEYLVGGYETQGEVCPTLCGLACYIGISERSIYNLGERDSRFLQSLEAVNTKQHTMLISKGLIGDFNPQITKLLLSNHGHSESVKTEMTATVKTEALDAKSLSTQTLTELLEARERSTTTD